MNTFKIGQKLTARSICDHNCIFEGTVIKRTAKFVTLQVKTFGEKRVGIKTDSDGEFCFPLGNYSMSPTFRA